MQVGSGHRSRSTRSVLFEHKIIHALQGSASHHKVGPRNEKKRVKERRWALEISTCWAKLGRPNGSDEGQITSLFKEEGKKGGSGKIRWAAIRRGRDGKTLQLRWNKIDTEIEYEKCSII